MKRLCCGDCGAWYGIELAFCSECGTLGEGHLPARLEGALLQSSVSAWADSLRRGVVWANLGPLAFLSATVDSTVCLATRQPAWSVAWLSPRISFSRLLPVQIFGLDLARLARETAWLEQEGFLPSSDFVISEEGAPCFYRLLACPGECSWALLTVPPPCSPEAQNWSWSFHSLLAGNRSLASHPVEAVGEVAGLEVLAVPGSWLDRLVVHRQALLARGQARPVGDLPRVGWFYRHYQLLTAGRVAAGLARGTLVQARGDSYRPHCLQHPWAPAVAECHFCRLPLCDTCGVKEESVVGCGLCATLKLEGPVSKQAGPTVARRTTGAALDALLAGLVCLLAGNLTLAVLLFPLAMLLMTMLGSPGRRLVGLRLEGQPDFLQLWLLAWTFSEPLSGCEARDS